VLFGMHPANRSLTPHFLICLHSLPATPGIPAQQQRQSLGCPEAPETLNLAKATFEIGKRLLLFRPQRATSLRLLFSCGYTTHHRFRRAAIPELMLGRRSGGQAQNRNRQEQPPLPSPALQAGSQPTHPPGVGAHPHPGTPPLQGCRSLQNTYASQNWPQVAHSADLRRRDFRDQIVRA